jgi:hypothetical protein
VFGQCERPAFEHEDTIVLRFDRGAQRTATLEQVFGERQPERAAADDHDVEGSAVLRLRECVADIVAKNVTREDGLRGWGSHVRIRPPRCLSIASCFYASFTCSWHAEVWEKSCLIVKENHFVSLPCDFTLFLRSVCPLRLMTLAQLSHRNLQALCKNL